MSFLTDTGVWCGGHCPNQSMKPSKPLSSNNPYQRQSGRLEKPRSFFEPKLMNLWKTRGTLLLGQGLCVYKACGDAMYIGRSSCACVRRLSASSTHTRGGRYAFNSYIGDAQPLSFSLDCGACSPGRLHPHCVK
uniref:Uncharacterized protein n=1 Tax=Cacopsylla melanoneura TaxID=428564 RepID=A0A8D8YCQ1_9HEMI